MSSDEVMERQADQEHGYDGRLPWMRGCLVLVCVCAFLWLLLVLLASYLILGR